MWKKPLSGQERLCLIFLSCLCFVIFSFSFSASCLLVLCPEVGEGPAGEEGQSPEPFLHGNAVLEPTAAAGCYGGFCGRLGSHLHRLTKGALGSRTRLGRGPGAALGAGGAACCGNPPGARLWVDPPSPLPLSVMLWLCCLPQRGHATFLVVRAATQD